MHRCLQQGIDDQPSEETQHILAFLAALQGFQAQQQTNLHMVVGHLHRLGGELSGLGQTGLGLGQGLSSNGLPALADSDGPRKCGDKHEKHKAGGQES